ncbi:MAG: fumarylacetoacetate hydrolase family protein [Myxococcales bacterium]|nr:fumarylacetoacetate hydrolase family protein [Myxococcales bacterium]
MRLVTFREGRSRTARLGALVEDDQLLDLTAAGDAPAFASMLALIEAGPEAWARARALTATAQRDHRLPRDENPLLAPLPRPPQMRDAMSFHLHIRQSNLGAAKLRAMASGEPQRMAEYEVMAASYELPAIYERQPVYYKANRFAVSGPGDVVHWPRYSRVMDFELELACVIGRGGKDIDRVAAREHIFGFTIFNDFSARDAQGVEMGGRLGPAKGKDFDGANALGPCITTIDEIGDPYALRMQARVNGETWCDSSSSTMHWKFEDLIAHISQGETLHPGEIIGSGTVGGGCGLELLRFLQSEDVVELEIDRIGVLQNRVRAAGGEA